MDVDIVVAYRLGIAEAAAEFSALLGLLFVPTDDDDVRDCEIGDVRFVIGFFDFEDDGEVEFSRYKLTISVQSAERDEQLKEGRRIFAAIRAAGRYDALLVQHLSVKLDETRARPAREGG